MFTKTQINTLKRRLERRPNQFPLVFSALGDPGRFCIFQLLTLMARSDICVTDVAAVMGISVSAASQQLKILEMVGLARKERMRQMICYKLRDDNPMVQAIMRLLG